MLHNVAGPILEVHLLYLFKIGITFIKCPDTKKKCCPTDAKY